MPLKTRKQPPEDEAPSFQGWACCKCSSLNRGSHHICPGVLPLQTLYNKPCNHWHCPTCHPLHDENAPPQSLPAPGRRPPPPVHNHHHHPHLSHTASKYPYTTAYLQSAAARGGTNTVTFAEAFPAPQSLPCADPPVVALANLRLDYLCGGSGDGSPFLLSSSSSSSSSPSSLLVGGLDGGVDGGYCGEELGHDRCCEEREGGAVSVATTTTTTATTIAAGGGGGGGGGIGGGGGVGREKRKRKVERDGERGLGVSGEGKKRDKGKGKGKGKAVCAWAGSVYPVGYQPASVEDVADGEDEEAQRYGYGCGWGDGGGVEEEW